jgi:hypothetical protein
MRDQRHVPADCVQKAGAAASIIHGIGAQKYRANSSRGLRRFWVISCGPSIPPKPEPIDTPGVSPRSV